MTAPTLPETLTRLAELLPERVLIKQDGNGNRHFYVWSGAGVRFTGRFEHVYVESRYHLMLSKDGAMQLEYALRGEIEAWGWLWRVWALAPGHGYAAEVEQGVLGRTALEYADTPAHALALALLAALEGAEA